MTLCQRVAAELASANPRRIVPSPRPQRGLCTPVIGDISGLRHGPYGCALLWAPARYYWISPSQAGTVSVHRLLLSGLRSCWQPCWFLYAYPRARELETDEDNSTEEWRSAKDELSAGNASRTPVLAAAQTQYLVTGPTALVCSNAAHDYSRIYPCCVGSSPLLHRAHTHYPKLRRSFTSIVNPHTGSFSGDIPGDRVELGNRSRFWRAGNSSWPFHRGAVKPPADDERRDRVWMPE